MICYSLSSEYAYCGTLQEPTTGPKIAALISLVVHFDLQLGPQHSCGNLKGPAASGTIRMSHSELPLHRPSMGLSHETIRMSHC